MKKTLSVITSILVFIAFLPSCTKTAKSYPASDLLIERKSYSLAYDAKHRQAHWVYEYLNSKNIKGHAGREGLVFQEDPLVPQLFQCKKKDYERSGFDRGHLCPAADACISDQAIRETFYLSNISPQIPQFNRGYWKKLENHVRDLTKKYKALHVYTGPLYLPHDEGNGKRYVKYQVIGENDIAVPTHFFKVIFAQTNTSRMFIEAYILPNTSIESHIPLEKFKATLQKVEKCAGVVFPPLK